MVGILTMTGAAAAILFPMMKRLDPTIESFSAYPGEHWRIAAGQPANTLFQIADGLCLALLAGAAITIGFRNLMRPRFRASASGVVRLVALFGLVITTAYAIFFLNMRMNETAVAFWEAAQAGRVDEADALRDAFQKDHPKSTVAMVVRMSFALCALGAGLWHALPASPLIPQPVGVASGRNEESA